MADRDVVWGAHQDFQKLRFLGPRAIDKLTGQLAGDKDVKLVLSLSRAGGARAPLAVRLLAANDASHVQV